MDILLAGYISRADFRQAASLIQPGTRVFQYNRTKTKNLAVPVSELKPLSQLFERVKEWEGKRQNK
jgi:tRNA(Ile2) C34 agmatinyltransferase TiaS